MPLFLSCDRTKPVCDDSHILHGLVVFSQQKKLVSRSVLRMSAHKYEFSVLLFKLEYPTFKSYFTNRKLVFRTKNCSQRINILKLSHTKKTLICALTEDSDQPVFKGLVTLRCLHGENVRPFK